MLVTSLLLLIFIVIVGLVLTRLRRQSQQATRRRQHREPAINQEMVAVDTDDALGLQVKIDEQQNPPPATSSIEKKSAADEQMDIIALHVMAPKEYPYSGYELLQALLANGLRYGEMNIFHRHETKTGRGAILFSLASVNKPGAFELPKMGSFSCPGLILFMVLKSTVDAMTAFDVMLETGRQLSEDLGGEVWDGQRQVLNMDKVAQIRARIRRFEEAQRIPDFFTENQTES